MQFRFPRVKNISTAQRALNLNKNGVKLFNQLGIAGNVLLIMPTLTSWRTPFVLGVSPKKKISRASFRTRRGDYPPSSISR